MTVIVQQPTDSNGNPQPMVYDSDTGKIIVDSNGYVINGGKRLVNVPTVSEYVSTTKTQTSGIQEAVNYLLNIIAKNMESYPNSPGGTIFFDTGVYLLTEDVTINPPSSIPNDELTITFLGTGMQSSMIYFAKTNGNGFVVASTYVQINTCFSNIALIQKAGTTINSMVDITSPSNTLFLNAWVLAGSTLGTVVNGGIYLHGNSGETQFVYIVGSVFAGTNILNVSGSGVLAVGSQLNWANPVDASMKVGAIRATSCSIGGTIYINQENVAHLTFMACNIIPQANFLVLNSTGRTYIHLLYNTISLNQNTTIFNGNTSGGQIRNFTSHGNTWEGGSDLTYYNPGSGSPSLWAIDIDLEDYANLSGTVSIPTTNVPPAIPTNPPVSGTTYQNTNYYAIRLKIPVTYNPTTTEAATLATGISSTSTVTTSTKVSLPSGLTAADGQILTYDMVVPEGWYYELVATNATIGTAEIEVA